MLTMCIQILHNTQLKGKNVLQSSSQRQNLKEHKINMFTKVLVPNFKRKPAVNKGTKVLFILRPFGPYHQDCRDKGRYAIQFL